MPQQNTGRIKSLTGVLLWEILYEEVYKTKMLFSPSAMPAGGMAKNFSLTA